MNLLSFYFHIIRHWLSFPKHKTSRVFLLSKKVFFLRKVKLSRLIFKIFFFNFLCLVCFHLLLLLSPCVKGAMCTMSEYGCRSIGGGEKVYVISLQYLDINSVQWQNSMLGANSNLVFTRTCRPHSWLSVCHKQSIFT